MLIVPSKNIANNGKGMYVGLKQPRGDGERCVTPARAAAKETMFHPKIKLYYTQTKKTMNTENTSGMFIVF